MAIFDFANAPSQQLRLPKLYDRDASFSRTKKKEIPHVELTKRDTKILIILWLYRILDFETLKFLLHFTGSNYTLWHRLRRLFQAGFIDRPKEAIVFGRIGGPRVLLALGRKGYEVVAPILDLPTDNHQAKQMTQKNNEIKFFYIAHALGLNRFHATLELACENHEHVNLAYWTQQNLKVRITPPSSQISLFRIPEKTIALISDALFTLQFPNEPSPNKTHYYVEFDNGSTPLSRWKLKKGLGYAEYDRQKLQSKFQGFKTFQVLIIAPTPERKHNMRKEIAEWLHTAKRRGTTYSPELWLFTDKTQYSLSNPQTLLEAPIWQTATDDTSYSLLVLRQAQ